MARLVGGDLGPSASPAPAPPLAIAFLITPPTGVDYSLQ